MQLGQTAMTKLPEAPSVEGLVGRQVSVGLLARHGFDLRTKLGTVLAPKFDFTSVSGIRIAYATVFGKESTVGESLGEPALARLEATRHLVVHRAGIVDDEYIRRTLDAMRIGEPLQLTGTQVSQLANGAVGAGSRLLRALDLWLTQNPPCDPSPDAGYTAAHK